MTENSTWIETLEKGLGTLIVPVPADPLINYLHLLHKWNKAYNLTAIRNWDEMVTKHILDSLAIAPFIKGPRLIDVGTGAGLPGIPLAIQSPNHHFVLLDSNGKKIRFLNEVKRQLQLTNIEIIESRVENYHPRTGFDTLTSRAFSEIKQMLHWTQHLIKPDGIWLLMKGRYPHEELTSLTQSYQVIPYTVNGVMGERHCVIIQHDLKE